MRLPALALLLLALVLPLTARTARAGGGPSEVVVIVNEASKDSERVAAHYVKARHIPPSQICRVRCSTELTVPVADFMRDVADPLRDFLRNGKLEERARFLVMTQGMPIRAKTGGNHVSTAAILSLLDSPIAGSDQERLPKHRPPYRNAGDPFIAYPGIGRYRLVTALISSTADEAIGLIDRSVASDGTAPEKTLAVFQDARGNAKVRNASYDAARKQLEALGLTTEHAAAGADMVTERKRVIAYMGGGSYSALKPEQVATNEFLPGAIADMLQSFGAVPENFVPGGKGKQFPITHLVRAGITGVHGAVAEPYTVAFPPSDLFEAYIRGFTLAETFHAKLPTAYWMNLVLGDPLCAPYAKRPVPVVKASGTFAPGATLELSAEGGTATRYRLYLDGRPIGAILAESGSFTVPESLPAEGGTQLLVEAIAGGRDKAVGWTMLDVKVAARDVPDAAMPDVSALEIRGPTVPHRVGPPLALSASGGPAGATVFVQIRTVRPPVLWAAGDVTFDKDGNAALPSLPMRKAGTTELVVRLPDHDLVAGRLKVVIRPGEATRATTPLSRVPERQMIDIPVRVEDMFGNLVESFEGEISLEAPGVDAPASVAANGSGQVVLRDVLFPRAGRVPLVFRLNGTRFSHPSEGITAAKGALQAWLVANAVPPKDERAKKLASGDPASGLTGHGDVASGLLFQRLRPGRDEVVLPSHGAGDGSLGVAVAFVHAYQDLEGELHLAARGGPVRVLVDGKPVHEGAAPSKDPRKPAKIAAVKLAKGRHRITVVAERKGRFGFALALVDGKGNLPGGLRVLSGSDDDPVARVVSGSVQRAGSPARGVTVELTAGEEKRTTVTDAAGQYAFTDVPEVETTVRLVNAPGGSPDAHTIEDDVALAADRDFRIADRSPPTVTLDGVAAGARFGRVIRVAPTVQDAGGIREVVLRVGGEVVDRATRSPWKLEWTRPAGDADRGALLEVAATDRSGNVGTSEGVAVQLVTDEKPPTVKVKGLRRLQKLKGVTTVSITVTDDCAVDAVTVTVNGTPMPTVLAADGTTSIDLDPKKVGAGKHELVVTAQDADGNETSKSIPFRAD